MLENSQFVVENLLAPLLSAQVFLVVLIYFTIVRKRIAANYKLYVCFLGTFIFFLIGRSIPSLFDFPAEQVVLLSRVFLLFSVGIPCLIVAMVQQSGLSVKKTLYWIPYSVGFTIAAMYVMVMDAIGGNLIFTREMVSFLPVPITLATGWALLLYGSLLCLVLPSTLLLIKELRGAQNRTLLAFLLGTFMFGMLMMMGASGKFPATIYYTASILPACCWAWAVFYDIRNMKGKAALLKEELQYLVLAGNRGEQSKIEGLLRSLEDLSEGDLDRYKIRVREILSMLTDVTISVGGDTSVLIERHKEQNRALETSGDSMEVRKLIQAEAEALSVMIAEMPKKRANVMVDRATVYIQEHFCEEITVETVSEHLGISRAHLMREFKKSTDQTVNQFITDLRMERAKELLADMTVTETAFEVGYNNSSYFGSVFKKYVGVTPIQFKKQCNPATD